MAETGLLLEVRWEYDGTELTEDMLIGETVLPVKDPYAFAQGDLIWTGPESTGNPNEVESVDTDASTITVLNPLEADYDEGTPLIPDVGGRPSQVWVADVMMPDGDTPIEVPLTVHDLSVMPEGEYDPPVAITLTDDLQTVIDLPGSLPQVPGEYIPPDSLPESSNTIYRQPDEPWANGTPGMPDNALWYDTDDNNKQWLWDADNLLWVDASDPRTDVLDNPDDILINDGNATIEDLIDAVSNVNETATSARNLASTADGRVSFSDYDPTPEDISYWQTNADGTLAKGASFEIAQAKLVSGIATLTLGDAGMITPDGGYIVVEGVGAPFDGEWITLDHATTELVITDAELTSGIATVTLASAVPWAVGQQVTISGLDDLLNGAQIIDSVAGNDFTFDVPGSPPDIPGGTMVGTATNYTVRYRIPNEADIGLFAVPDPAIGYNVPLLQRVEGSIWYTRTRARLSHITNPSFEVDLTGWTGVAAALTRIDPVIPDDETNPDTPIGGNWVAEVANDGTTGDHRAEWPGGAPGMPVQQGETYSATCYAALVSGSGDGAFASIRFYNASDVLIDEVEGPALSLVVDDWIQLEVTADVPVGATKAAPMILHNPNAGAVWRIDGALVEQAEYAGRYFDGDFYDSHWGEDGDGTPHASVSVMEGGKIISVYELYDGAWVRLDFTGSTQYDGDASDLTMGTLDPERLADDSVPPDKIKGTPMRVSDAVTAGDFVNVWDNGGLFFVRPAIANVDGKEAHGFVRESGAAGDIVTIYTDGYNDLLTGLAPGTNFLSPSVAGKATRDVPQNAGEFVQQIGAAVNENTIHFNPTSRVLLF